MARIFSIDFEFEHQHYTALVSLCEESNGCRKFTVAPTDEHIRQLLPGGKISFSTVEEISDHDQCTKLHHLLQSLTTSVQRKLYSDGINKA